MNRMEQKVNVLDFQVDILTLDLLNKTIDDYCKDEQMRAILFLSVPIIEEAMDSPDYRRMVAGFQMLLPGEEEILFRESEELLERKDVVINESCMEGLLRGLEKSRRSVYLVGDELEKTELFLHYCEEQCPTLQLVGTFVTDENMDDEKLLNDINTNCPDVILTAIAPQLQENWIMENADKLNGKVCIGADILIQKVVEQYLMYLEKEVHTRVYNNLIKIKKNLMKNIHKRIFCMEYEQYMKQNKD
ncbi:MAG: WecB/TagA/CpsF family glycosyltransferase [Lachnospiraceae bacterium]|nr:WecB/TagA/CpsF family glycosyltransferase [Lachnospiraceae bacterium]